MGKTLIAKSFAAALGLHFARVQFTPDLLPPICSAPLSTTCIRAVFEFRKGPIFTNLLLADEINRTSPKTQAALLEAMAERRVGIDGITHPLPAPFLVLANDIRSNTRGPTRCRRRNWTASPSASNCATCPDPTR